MKHNLLFLITLILFNNLGFAQEQEEGNGILPILHINVKDPITGNYNNQLINPNYEEKAYFDGEYWLEANGCTFIEDAESYNLGSESEPLPLQIKGRGNYTLGAYSKKPYKIKLGKKQSLLGLTKSKHFALLAHADDSDGYLRNFVGFNLGKRIGLPWTPSVQPIELFINGDYRGIYFLTESIRVEENRIEIAELNENEEDPSLISGGYLVELDNYTEENQIIFEEKHCAGKYPRKYFRVTFKEPEVLSAIQRQFITDQFNAINDATEVCNVDRSTLWSYVDLDDAVRFYLVREIATDMEAYVQSTYLFRDRGADRKWHFSPLWDFGQAFWENARKDYFIYYARFGTTWLESWLTNEMFRDKINETWVWFMQNRYDGIEEDIDNYISIIAEAAKRDAERWKDAPLPTTTGRAEAVKDNSDIQAKATRVKEFLSDKTNWMKSQFGDYAAMPLATEPERDTTPAAPLPSYVKTDVNEVIASSPEFEIPSVIYNLQGEVIAHPTVGQIYIVTDKHGSKKIIWND